MKKAIYDSGTVSILRQVAKLSGSSSEHPKQNTGNPPTGVPAIPIGSGLDFAEIDSILSEVKLALKLAKVSIH